MARSRGQGSGQEGLYFVVVCSLAHGLGLTVVAEGVETEAEREFLVNHGCDELQGYLLGRPESKRRLTLGV